MKYTDKLKDPRWQKKRLEIMQRDGWECTICGDKNSTLHVHHKSYQNRYNPWEVDDKNLTTLCENCHLFVEYPDQKIIDCVMKVLENKILNGKSKRFIVNPKFKTD